jgi:hypothetical protein
MDAGLTIDLALLPMAVAADRARHFEQIAEPDAPTATAPMSGRLAFRTAELGAKRACPQLSIGLAARADAHPRLGKAPLGGGGPSGSAMPRALGLVEIVALDLVGEADARQAKLLGRPALIPAMPMQHFRDDALFDAFDLVLERRPLEDEAHALARLAPQATDSLESPAL